MNQQQIQGKTRLLNVQELAQVLNLPASWIYNRVSVLPHFRAGRHIRFHLKTVVDWLRQTGGHVEQEKTAG